MDTRETKRVSWLVFAFCFFLAAWVIGLAVLGAWVIGLLG
jgi:hypothetical protein